MTTAHDFTFTSIEGKPLPLSEFTGKTVLLVNTASACGLTPQYEGLQKLWDAKSQDGLVVLGVPSNDFGAQEPGSEAEVQSFCQVRYGVTFPLTSKNPVTGKDAHPLYKWIAEQTGDAGLPKWNFHKYLIGKDGSLLGTFGSMTAPDAPELTSAIDTALMG
jgi:glutathione peroxidase